MDKIVTIISRKLFFNSILRGLLEGYLKFSISTFLAFKKLDHVETKEDYLNAGMTVTFATIIFGFPPFTYTLLHKYKHKLNDEDFKGRFESLYLNVDT